jgi:sugar lactone lactonase YvrE
MMSLAVGSSWRRFATVLAGVCVPLLCAATFASSANAASITNWAATGYSPAGIAVDSAGNIYTANPHSDNVSKITPAGVSTPNWAETGGDPVGIAVDSAGNIYTANTQSDNVSKITPAGVSTPNWAATGYSPRAITVDSAGNIYTANAGSETVSKITPDGVSTPNWAATGSDPRAIAVDSAGNIYTANYIGNNVSKITPDGTSTILGTTGTNPRAITVDSAGNIYTANPHLDNVSKITPAGGSTPNWAETGRYPVGITVDSAGNIYTANNSSNNVSKITPAGVSTTNWAATGNAPTGITIDSAGNIYTSNESSDDVSKITPTVTNGMPDIFPAPPARPSAPTAAAGSPGSGAAAVTVTANPISAAFGAPSSYTISAAQDESKGCVVTSPTTSCSVAGLTIGAAYTFTARANLNSWQTAQSVASNSVAPAAAVPDPTPAKPAITWASSAKAKTITAVITPVVGVIYTLTATSGRMTKKGSCKNVTIKQGKKKVARRSCTVKLAKGKWLASVTPKKGSVSGTALSKAYSFK